MFYSRHLLARAYWRVLEVPVLGRSRARPFVLGAPVGPRPLEDLEVPVLSSTRARLRVPGAPVGPRPLEHGQVAALCRICTEVVPKLLPQGPFDSAHHHVGHARRARRRVRPARPRDLIPRQGLLARRRQPELQPAGGGRGGPVRRGGRGGPVCRRPAATPNDRCSGAEGGPSGERRDRGRRRFRGWVAQGGAGRASGGV